MAQMLDIQIGVAKVNKYASRESGDTCELVERPGVGGFSAIVADGQGSGKAAKTLSNMVSGKCMTLIKEGVRDSVAMRATSDYLFAARHGQVSATLNLISADFATRSLVVGRNNTIPAFLLRLNPLLPTEGEVGGERLPEGDGAPQFLTLNAASQPIGVYSRTRPVMHEVELEPGMWAVAFTDGIWEAGQRYEQRPNWPELLQSEITADPRQSAQTLADKLLNTAIQADRNRPTDDMCLVVLATYASTLDDSTPLIRRTGLSLTLP